MSEAILSVGIDIGTSTTQLIFSRLTLVNQASAFSVPRISIADKEILYRSAIYFTPLLSDTVIDTAGVLSIVAAEYQAAGMDQAEIDTGAVIITGETARKENAQEVLHALSGYAGEFVVATAGPDLESVLAAKGAGIDQYSEEHACIVLNFDIGGGTTNLALFSNGNLIEAGCMNVGGRLIKLSPNGVIEYISPVLDGRFPLSVGQAVSQADLEPVVQELVAALEEAAGLQPRGERFSHYLTTSAPNCDTLPVFSFSGGVGALIYDDSPADWLAYGDLGVLLSRAIRNSALFSSPHICPRETIRATVVGAGAHSTELSGSTIRYEGIQFPIQNLPVIALGDVTDDLAQRIRERLDWYRDNGAYEPVVLALDGLRSPGFAQVQSLASAIVDGMRDYLSAGQPLYVVLLHDMAKALGQCLLPLLPQPPRMVCLDSLHLQTGQYLDIGAPVAGGAVLPVVIKTLIFTS
jgi:ethanolamine utilization protein EutA